MKRNHPKPAIFKGRITTRSSLGAAGGAGGGAPSGCRGRPPQSLHALKPEPPPEAQCGRDVPGSRPQIPPTTDSKHPEEKRRVADLSGVGGTMAASEHVPTFFFLSSFPKQHSMTGIRGAVMSNLEVT